MFAKLATSLLALSGLVAPVLAAPLDARNTNSSGLVPFGKRATAGEATWYGKDESDPHFLCDMLPNNYYSSNDMVIVAIAYPSLINNGNKNQYCGRYITVEYQGKTVTAQVVDGCASCTNNEWIDLSPGAISQIDPNYKNDGRISVNWWWADGDGGSGNQETTTSTKTKETSTWVEPTSTWTPPPSPTPTSTEPPPTSTYVPPSSTEVIPSITSSIVPSSSAAPSSLVLSSITAMSSISASVTSSAVNASMTASVSGLANVTTSANTTSGIATVAIANATATIIAPDAVVSTAGSADGNLAVFNNLIASLGRIIIAGAQL